ncbi:bifunctional [glutamine synthetase] adenylyltransferase/[glutamine synthetase]-adenylyl-L-tyrosine phosphorylase [Prosthecomicrobium sp. N25]|uniref:bifunctional [glutamine synthetase] adenylyltransferase/[glutamine synthetase]-adenylyl-L-tyrosine phosphorylase n=1 Tax=Prosthecomicrobium sp. N25 TaxID=3129254 RepID=UPI00307772DC
MDRIATVFAPDSKKSAKLALDRLAARARDEDGGADLLRVLEDRRVRDFLAGVLGSSPYLTELAVRDPERLARILEAPPEAGVERLIAAAGQAVEDEPALMRHLRLLKQEAALTLALADLAGALPTLAVTRALTRFADAAISAALRAALADVAARGKMRLLDEADPEKGSGLIVLAMGKQGAYELNYSSDCDLIVFFDHARVKDRLADPDEAVDLFVRVVKRMVKILQERTPDGYVFRVDLRLRPDPGATPVAMSVDAALQYYESMGQNWERAALIKARPCAGDPEAGEAFLAEIRPYVWRKYFDYAAIADVHSIKRQIHAHKGHGDIAVLGHNVKLGRGGIREIEFFVQTQQLIAGGRNPRLRGRETLGMLDELVDQGWIGQDVRDALREAYLFLRNVEHRIQMVADEQTHTLPEDVAGATRIARMMGFRTLDDFSAALRRRLETVQRHYARLFESAPQLSSGKGNLVFTGDDDDPGTIETLSRMGYARPSEVTAAIRAWHFGRYPATRSTVARERLTELTPALLEVLAATANADAAFLAFDRFVARLPAGIQIFSILVSNPRLLHLLAEIMGAAPKLAEILSRRPRVIDAVLEPAFFDTLPGEAELRARLDTYLAEASGYEEVLDRIRIFGQEQVFLIGVRILTGTLSVTQAGVAYATLAGLLVATVLRVVEAEMERVHGRVPGGAAAVVAMGKLGGREMTAASDLDLMLLYDYDPASDMSDGPKPLMAGQYYARLTQRLIAAISAPTAEGTLYAVDFRLRPSGNKGPVATRLSGFRDYHASEAWTWEHMALTRARVIAGPPAFAASVETAIRAALVRPRDLRKLKADVLEMRGLIEAEKGTRDVWDIKQAPGGLVDVEFVAQYLMLAAAARHPDVLSTNTALALAHLADRGLLDRGEAEVLIPAVRLYHHLTQVLRLALDGPFEPAKAPRGLLDLLARSNDMPDFKVLAATLTDTEAAVRAAFERLIGRVPNR